MSQQSNTNQIPVMDGKSEKIIQLSVVILTYNSGKTIASCLDSLVSQNNKNFKVIIVDDDSKDDTLQIVNSYKISHKLNLDVVINGSHNIPKGRNIGLKYSTSDFVAFLDSDDCAEVNWTKVIIEFLNANPEMAAISGPMIFFARNAIGKAIAFNDSVTFRLFGKGILRFLAGNSAFNKSVIGNDISFNEDFTYAEDLEIASELQKKKYKWLQIPEMQIYHSSRTSLKEYASQMYHYGLWKFYYEFATNDYRFIDFIPLAVILLSVLFCILFGSWFPISLFFLFSFAESVFVVLMPPRKPAMLLFSFPAWLVKNFFWSMGIVSGLINLSIDKELKMLLERKR